MGAVSFKERVSIGFVLPVAIINKGDLGFTNLSVEEGFGLGDLSVSVKTAIVKRTRSGWALGLAVDGKFPTGRKEAFLRDAGIVVMPQLIFDFDFKGYRAAVNVGYKIRDEFRQVKFVVDDELDWRVGFEAPLIVDTLSLKAQVVSTTPVGDLYGQATNNYLEIDGGFEYKHRSGIFAIIGGGGCISQGYGNVQMRLFAGLGYAPSLAPPDSDGDGLIDEKDQCPAKAEDKDNYEDLDGCPEPDNDGDGILDAVDKCPVDKEDVDGFEDDDGCPEYDNDSDGMSDANDMCPDEAEDVDGFEDGDGCPETDNDEDGIVDAEDNCPLQPETVNQYQDEDGCPDRLSPVEIKGDKLFLHGTIAFKGLSDRLTPESVDLLKKVARFITQNPQLVTLRALVSTGDRVKRQRTARRLSRKRAIKVVSFLLSQGLKRGRVLAMGEGKGSAERIVFEILKVE